jgi:hypothetical protein
MNVFAVVALNDQMLPDFKTAIEGSFPGNNLEAGKTVWLVADPGTTLNVSEKLGIKKEPPLLRGVLVINFTSYFGRAPGSLWEWIKAKLEETPK